MSPRLAWRSCELYWGEAWLSIWRLFEAEAILDVLSAVLPRDRPIVVLDAGAGDGRFYELLLAGGLSANEIRATGVDGDVNRLRRISARNLTPVLGDLEKLPLPTNSVDVVICNSTLEHLSETQVAIDEFARVLRRDGVLLLTVPSIHFESLLLGYQLRVAIGRRQQAIAWAQARSRRIRHFHYESPEQWIGKLRAADLRLHTFRPIVPAPAVTIGDPLQWLRDWNIGGSRYSRRMPARRDIGFAVMRKVFIVVEWLLVLVIGFFGRRTLHSRSGAYFFAGVRE